MKYAVMALALSSPVTADYEKPWDLGGLDDANLQETAIMDSSSEEDICLNIESDDVRETAILDSDTEDENTKWQQWNHVGATVIQNQMQTNILDSDDEYTLQNKHNSSKKGKGKGVRDSLAVADLRDRSPSAYSDNSHRDTDTLKKDRDQSRDKSLPRRSKSRDESKDKKRDNTIKRDKDKKDKAKKDKEKQKEKDKQKDKDKHKDKDKQTNKDKQKDKDKVNSKDKKDKDKQTDQDKQKTKDKEKDHKLSDKEKKEELKKDKNKNKESKKDKKRGNVESESSSKSDLKKKESKKKDSKKLSRKDTKRRRKEAKKDKVRMGSVSSADEEEIDGIRGFRGSEESFVTAPSERSFADEGIYNEVFEDDGAVTKQPLSANYNDVAIDMESPYDIEMIEYPDLKDTPMNFNIEDQYDEVENSGKVTVPISICLVIIAGYIFAGSVLFTLWEEWDYLTGSYFCFITLSTIGFGDIVPGTDMKEWASHEKLVLCALWLAFGLSLLAMCFNLMQEEVKEKCKWLGQKLGLLKDDDEG